MTTPYQRQNPRRQGFKGRTARINRRKKVMLHSNTQSQHKGFRKVNPSLIYVAPSNGYVEGYINLINLLGHAEVNITFEEADTLVQKIRNGRNIFPKTYISGGETIRVFVKPIEDTATVDSIRIGIMFRETK